MKTFKEFMLESDDELHGWVKKTKNGAVDVVVSKSKNKNLVKGTTYKLSDIDPDGGYNPTGKFTDSSGKSVTAKLYDVNFK